MSGAQAARHGALPVLPPQPEALRHGACATSADPDIWASNHPTERALAIRICRSCPVRAACLAWALTLPPGDNHLIWAGLSPASGPAWPPASACWTA